MSKANIKKDPVYGDAVEIKFDSPIKIRVQYTSGVVRDESGPTMIYPSETFENVTRIVARVGTMYIGPYHRQDFPADPTDGELVHYYSLEMERTDETTVEIHMCLNFFTDDPEAETFVNQTKKILEEWADRLFEN